ncbi:hypothetical protein FCULG_00001909 [Fusarium culmorum]|uniref:DUF6546 domain-containing protein n=1 Tax=Fusarium culmorum TaxID=5516 RepID=A0A2T4GQ65_FUSCU|nr:hypothetical protein FCULG_00001909 [Fusarium culmorum]
MVSEEYGAIDDFLCAVAKVAKRMPQLETLELWISEETMESWKGVVDVEGAEFSVEHLDLDPDKLTSIGQLYPYLALRDRILHVITWTEA